MKFYLKEPTMEEKEEIIKMVQEFEESNDFIKFEGIINFKGVNEENYSKFLLRNKANKIINQLNPEWANQTTYVLIDNNGHIYGAANIRHQLVGNFGHIGYAIRPSERKKGYGKEQLKLILEKVDELGIEEVLLTCRENNLASMNTMKKCIGWEDSYTESQIPGIREFRYWIDVKKELNKVNKKQRK